MLTLSQDNYVMEMKSSRRNGRNKRQPTVGKESGLETTKTSIHSCQSVTFRVFDKCRTEGSSCQTLKKKRKKTCPGMVLLARRRSKQAYVHKVIKQRDNIVKKKLYFINKKFPKYSVVT